MRIPLEAPALDPFPDLPPQCTSLVRSCTRSLWEPKGSLHHQHFRSPDSRACSPGPPGESRGPSPRLLPAASFPVHSSDRHPAPTHQPVPTRGPCTGGWGVLKRGEKLAPPPPWGGRTRGAAFQRKEEEVWVSAKGRQRFQSVGDRDSKRPARDSTRDPGSEIQRWGREHRETWEERAESREEHRETQGKSAETQEKAHRDPAKSTESRGKEHRDPARENRETPGGVADSRETPGLLGGGVG